RELVEQIRQIRNIKEECLIKQHQIRQNNGSDCGIAVIAIMRRIIELKNQSWVERLKYGKFRMGDDLGGMDFSRERQSLREEYLAKK
ncbi:6950_t:CDS:1, partial [Cetraspora pellucida]